jgi:3-deoxy-D-manno-octulosonate 8-phosphate phosphatase KdsC-like HAD superfamily phosphatase
MFVGNDINDIPAFKSVGIPVAVADAYPEVYPHVLARTTRPGGQGAVREVCDWVYGAIKSEEKGAQ